MIPFLYLTIFRALSGLQNGLGYGQRQLYRVIISIIMLIDIVSLTVYLHLLNLFPWQHWMALCCLMISAIGTFGVEDNFSIRLNLCKRDIHLWELLATGGVTLASILMGLDIIGIACSIYPGLILHKGFVNVCSGLSWWYHGTDDTTGKTFNVPTLGIRVPRLSVKGRVILACVSMLTIVITSTSHYKISILSMLL